jgi:V/A-type H+-transporting ATPase subunit I
MIVPMRKYRLLVFHRDFHRSLEDLMELGVMDITTGSDVSSEETEELSLQLKLAGAMVSRLAQRKANPDSQAVPDSAGGVPLDEISRLEEELEEIRRKQILHQQEIQVLEPWGEFRRASLERLRNAGVRTRFYSCAPRQFQVQWQQAYPLQVIYQDRDQVCFVIFEKGQEIEFPLHEVGLPQQSLSALQAAYAQNMAREQAIEAKLDEYAAHYRQWLQQEMERGQDRLQFLQATLNARRLPEHRLMLIEGWCPETARKRLLAWLETRQIPYVVAPHGVDGPPPVLLKNNAFTRLFEPIGNLFSLPSASEWDLTPYFAPFFLLFFGFCLGDAGYGLVLLAGTTIARWRLDDRYQSYLRLAQWFGLSTLIVGLLSGTFFGLELASVPALFRFRGIFLEQGQLFNLALAIGFIQILFGILIRAWKNLQLRGWKYAVSPLGWIVTMLSLADLYVLAFAPAITGVTVWLGVTMIVLFGSPERRPLASVAFGLLDLYNVTSILGDLLSYIRLFALGVSSAILGLVVNSIALKALGIPYIGVVLFVLMLVVGHTANLLLASLSAFVHPMRLTFVEFYKNAGFEGGGKAFRPFAKRRPGESVDSPPADIQPINQ